MREPITPRDRNADSSSLTTSESGTKLARPGPKLNRYVVVTVYCVALVLCGPLLNNWAPLRKMLVANGAYAHACGPEDELDPFDGTCTAQQNLLSRLPVVAQSLQFAFAIIGGFCKDWFGSKATAILGFSAQTLAYLSLALAAGGFDGYILGFVLFGAASEPSALGLMDVIYLFPEHEATVIACMGTARSLSFFCSNILEAIFAAGVPYYASWLIFVGVGAFVTLVIGVIVPRRGYAPVESGARELRFSELCRMAAHPTYVLFVIYFTTVVLRMGFFSASSDRQIPEALSFFGVMVPLSFIPCPVFGYLADRVGHWFVVHIINASMIGMYLTTLVTSTWSQYTAVVFSFMVYSFQSSQAYCVVAKTVPDVAVGRLLGLCFFIAGILGLSNTAIFNAVNNADAFHTMDWVYAGVGVVMVGLIFVMALCNRRRPIKPLSEHCAEISSSELSTVLSAELSTEV